MKYYKLDELLATVKVRPERTQVERREWTGPERPGDEFNRLHAPEEILEWLDFSLTHTDSQGSHWTRPGKDVRDGASATVYQEGDETHATIWSDTCVQMWPALEVRRPYDAFGLYVATHFAGDYAKATAVLNEGGYGELPSLAPNLIDELEAYLMDSVPEEHKGDEDASTGWEPVDLVAAMRAGPPPPPDIFRRSDQIFLLYRKKIHYFYGPPESLKSWAAQVAAAWTFLDGQSVLVLDFENDQYSFMERMLALGVNDEQGIRERLIYLKPDKPFTEKVRNQLRAILERGADLVIVDGISNAMLLLGKNPMDHQNLVEFEMMFLRPLTISGGAVVGIDHTAKDVANPTLFGGQHKKAAVTGACFYFRLDTPFGRGMSGMAKLELDKDKPGFLRQYVEDKVIAELHLHSKKDGTVLAELNVPDMAQDFRPTGIMENLSRYVETNPGVTVDQVKRDGTSSEKADWVRRAWQLLEQEGWLSADMGGLVRSVKPYRDPFNEGSLRRELEPSVPNAQVSPRDEGRWERYQGRADRIMNQMSGEPWGLDARPVVPVAEPESDHDFPEQREGDGRDWGSLLNLGGES